MPHDVFISYSSHDKAVADAACAVLEAQKIRCWIAPRDVLPGTEYGEALVNAIGSCQVVVLILGPPSKAEASAGARQAIEEIYGEDLLAGHRPAQITARIAEEADLILVMDHKLLNPKVLPAAKTFVLKPFLGLEGDVDDPWPDDGSVAAAIRYSRCARELKGILETNLDKLIYFSESTAHRYI